MYEYIMKNKRATYALDKVNGIETFENTKNINEIIITTNNLDQMNILYNKYCNGLEEELSKYKNNYKKALIYVGIYSLLSIVFSLHYISFGLGMTYPLIKTIVFSIQETKTRKNYNKKLSIINETIEKEERYLEFLKETDEKIEIKEAQEKIELETSEEVRKLSDQLILIEFVLQNKKELKILYKFNLLEKVLGEELTDENIEYIKFLLSKKKENNKVKQLKK